MFKKEMWLSCCLLGLMVFMWFLLGASILVTDGTIQNRLVWFENYQRVGTMRCSDWGSGNSLGYSLCALLLRVILAVMLCALRKNRGFAIFIRYLPGAFVGAADYLMILFDCGPIDRMMAAMGGQRVLAGDRGVPVLLLYIWRAWFGGYLSAALSSVPDEYYEFARLEGASVMQQECKITLPLILPTAFLVFVLAWVNAFKIFKEVYFIGGAYPRDEVYTLQHYMNNQFAKLDYQLVTTAAYSFALIVFALFGLLYLGKGVRGHDR